MNRYFKKIITHILCGSMLLSLSGCAGAPAKSDGGDIDGKTVLIIGNSYVFNGMTVIYQSQEIQDRETRTGDNGYFYQLCKANGHNVTVTNWTFSGHGLYDFLDFCNFKGCKTSHLDNLGDAAFDYVIIAPGGGERSGKEFVENFDALVKFFKEANPDVKIVCLGNLGAHGYSSFGTEEPEIYTHYKNLEKDGVIIADWGGMVNGIIDGKYVLSGSTLEYNKNSFIVKDGFHPNALCGYLAALMAYCTITGESAVGQPYAFCSDRTLDSHFDLEDYAARNYKFGDSNMLDIFASENEMLALQKLTDEYISSKPYLND